jgi:hypothetical protein
MTYQRKCDNWLETFTKWTLPKSEAPESFILWTAMFTLASAVRRHVNVPKRMLGSWSPSPNLYVMFIAPPGKARKSTTANYAEELLDELHDITKSPTIVTTAALTNRLVNAADSSVYILSAEFGSFIKKSGVEMFEFLTDVFDGRKSLEGSTISRGVEFVERPCVNLLGATTPRWISENMPESVIGGGFASRVIFVYEERVRRRQLFFEELDHAHLEKLKTDLIDDLRHISENCHGEFVLEDDAKAFMEAWYRKNADATGDNNNLQGYFERKPAHIFKVAMLIHLSYSDELVITEGDFKDAIKLLESVEAKLPKVFENTGKNTYSFEMKDILAYIKHNERVEQRELFKKFYTAAQPNLLEELITGLLKMGVVKTEMEGTNIFFIPAK